MAHSLINISGNNRPFKAIGVAMVTAIASESYDVVETVLAEQREIARWLVECCKAEISKPLGNSWDKQHYIREQTALQAFIDAGSDGAAIAASVDAFSAVPARGVDPSTNMAY